MSVTLDAVTVRFGERAVLDRVSASFPSGTLSAVMGPSGAGKSTLLGTIAGYVVPDSGTVNTGGVPLSQIGFVFQGTHLIPARTALDNIALGALARGHSFRTARAVSLELMEGLELAHLAMRRAFLLSGGERQRVMILRAVAFESPILLADEPTASLDPTSRSQVVKALELASTMGATVIVSTHDETVAAQCAQIVRLWD